MGFRYQKQSAGSRYFSHRYLVCLLYSCHTSYAQMKEVVYLSVYTAREHRLFHKIWFLQSGVRYRRSGKMDLRRFSGLEHILSANR